MQSPTSQAFVQSTRLPGGSLQSWTSWGFRLRAEIWVTYKVWRNKCTSKVELRKTGCISYKAFLINWISVDQNFFLLLTMRSIATLFQIKWLSTSGSTRLCTRSWTWKFCAFNWFWINLQQQWVASLLNGACCATSSRKRSMPNNCLDVQLRREFANRNFLCRN